VTLTGRKRMIEVLRANGLSVSDEHNARSPAQRSMLWEKLWNALRDACDGTFEVPSAHSPCDGQHEAPICEDATCWRRDDVETPVEHKTPKSD